MKSSPSRLAVFTSLWVLLTAQAFAVTQYQYVDLSMGGTIIGQANAVNDSGQVVGTRFVPGTVFTQESRAFTWANGIAQDLYFPAGTFQTLGMDINNAGTIAAIIQHTPYMGGESAIYHADGSLQLLSTPGYTTGVAYGINNQGQVVGGGWAWSDTPGYVYTNGVLTPLPNPSAGTRTVVKAINDNGQIVVQTVDANNPASLGPTKINNNGTEVGTRRIAGPSSTAIARAYFTQYGVPQNLLPEDPALMSYAESINDLGFVVGYQQAVGSYPSDQEALLWDSTGQVYNLNDLTSGLGNFRLSHAMDINADGVIVGWGYESLGPNLPGPQRPFMLVPVPEPGSMVLILGAFATALAGRRRSLRVSSATA